MAHYGPMIGSKRKAKWKSAVVGKDELAVGVRFVQSFQGAKGRIFGFRRVGDALLLYFMYHSCEALRPVYWPAWKGDPGPALGLFEPW